MNDNFLQVDPTAIFDEFFSLPEEAFDNLVDVNEMRSLMNTVLENDDFSRVLQNLKEQDPEVFAESFKRIKDYSKKLSQGEYGKKDKYKIGKIFLDRALEVFEEIVAYDGYFQKVPVKITKISPKAVLPKYQSGGDAGADIYLSEHTVINPGETKILKTGLKLIIPGGYEVQIRPRSGMSLKTGLRIPNSPGTIDCEYRDEIGVIAQNIGTEPITLTEGTRIAQMVLKRQPKIVWKEISNEEFNKYSTDRGEGFGSSGQ